MELVVFGGFGGLTTFCWVFEGWVGYVIDLLLVMGGGIADGLQQRQRRL